MEKKRKPKACKNCGKEFLPFSSLEKFCTKKCSIEAEKSKKIERKSKQTT
jgi:hypothetical protein